MTYRNQEQNELASNGQHENTVCQGNWCVPGSMNLDYLAYEFHGQSALKRIFTDGNNHSIYLFILVKKINFNLDT